MDAWITELRRRVDADPTDNQGHLELVLALKRRVQPFLEESLAALRAGLPLGERGIQRRWFREHWEPVRYRANRIQQPELLAGPLAALRGVDLHAAELRQRDLRSCSLRFANLDGADLWKADLSGAALQRASLNGANLIGARLVGADLSYAQLTRGDFIEADLRGANLQGAILDRANLRGARLEGADLRGASLFATKVRPWPREDVLIDEATLWPNGMPTADQPPHLRR